MKIQTVNVIEYADNNILGVTSFSDEKDGNREAEAHFLAVAKENYGSDVLPEPEDFYLDEGIFENSTYQVFIVHS
jgi:hypothetical protein